DIPQAVTGWSAATAGGVRPVFLAAADAGGAGGPVAGVPSADLREQSLPLLLGGYHRGAPIAALHPSPSSSPPGAGRTQCGQPPCPGQPAAGGLGQAGARLHRSTLWL